MNLIDDITNRCVRSIEAPVSYLSIISDGMAQNHCKLPWHGNINGASKYLTQHIQGIIVHGRRTVLFRTFHTVNNGGNLQLHCFLLTLEQIYKDNNGKFNSLILFLVSLLRFVMN